MVCYASRLLLARAYTLASIHALRHIAGLVCLCSSDAHRLVELFLSTGSARHVICSFCISNRAPPHSRNTHFISDMKKERFLCCIALFLISLSHTANALTTYNRPLTPSNLHLLAHACIVDERCMSIIHTSCRSTRSNN